jgi:hypothetical protein
MHKSRLGAVVIDCQGNDLAVAGAFWGAALGLRPETSSDPLYARLVGAAEDVALILQKVGHESRVHLDIETDDVEAEVARLEKLGATRVAQVKSWWVMQAPTGHRFCVVEPQRPGFESGATHWE